MVQDYAGQVQFILINSCPGPEESAYKMKEIYGKWNLPIPYLEDKVQEAMNKLVRRKVRKHSWFRARPENTL